MLDTDKQSSVSHYDAAYYESHYKQFLNESAENLLLAEFYAQHVIRRFAPDVVHLLDYGSGLGQLTSTFGGACYDPSEFAQRVLRAQGRKVFGKTDEIPSSHYDVVFSSHALEHSYHPASELRTIHRVLIDAGTLILIVPQEQVPGIPTQSVDSDRHFYAWNFQCLANLLLYCNFKIIHQQVLYGPFGLRTLARYVGTRPAMRLAERFGRWKRQYPALLTVASKAGEDGSAFK
jgi:SAM-dependent methyltransferase